MNRPHFRRHPRPEPEPPRDWIDWLGNGLPSRDYRQPDKDELAHAEAWLEAHRAEALRASGGLIATGGTVILDADDRIRPLDGLPTPTRYDAEWPDVLAAEAPGGDLAAMAAPLTDWGVDWRYVDASADQSGLTGWGEGYEIEAEATLLASALDTVAEMDARRQYVHARLMVRAGATAYDLGLPVPLRSDPPIYRACLEAQR